MVLYLYHLKYELNNTQAGEHKLNLIVFYINKYKVTRLVEKYFCKLFYGSYRVCDDCGRFGTGAALRKCLPS